MPSIAAVIFDLDGVLIDSEGLWNEARMEIASENGGRWREEAQRAMMGMSSLEWSRYMHEDLGVAMEPEQISELVVSRLERLYRERVPLLPGAGQAVIASRWRPSTAPPWRIRRTGC
jgi:beta-phosphoglucomutase-like phosphatase (HAD superfamily)